MQPGAENLPAGSARDVGESGPVGSATIHPAEQALDALLEESHLAGGHDIPNLVAAHVPAPAHDAVVYLTDLQQRTLIPFLPARPSQTEHHVPLGVDSTVAGRAFQLVNLQTQEIGPDLDPEGRTRAWLPLLDGTDRLGVLAVTVDDASALTAEDGALTTRLQRFATLLAELVVSKSMYGDSIVRLRRSAGMGLAAEMQWSLLPPLTFASETVSVAGGLEPAYAVAGDSLDYAVEAGTARFAVFDGMGHGLASAQLTSLAVAAYRNGRRAGLSLVETVEHVDATVSHSFHQDGFATALVGELDTVTGLFTWMSAGHLAPLLMRDGRAVRSLEVEPVLPLGLGRLSAPAPDGAHRRAIGQEQLQPGDLLLLYTDGVTEARSPDGEFFGLDRLVDMVVRNLAAGLPAAETMRRVVRALLEHQSGDLDDDATLVLVQWHGNPKGRLQI